MGRCGASRRVGATGGSHGGAAGQSRPLQAASSHRGVASLSATLLRTSAANFSFASELDSCRGGKQRMPPAHTHLRRARLLLRARVRTRQQAAAGGSRRHALLRESALRASASEAPAAQSRRPKPPSLRPPPLRPPPLRPPPLRPPPPGFLVGPGRKSGRRSIPDFLPPLVVGPLSAAHRDPN